MSKNRLLQIINRLKLTPKDKKDLVNIIESDQKVSLGTPDWNANEAEEGYIKNRTHYVKKVNLVTVSKENFTSEPYEIGNMDSKLYYREENKGERYVELKYQVNPNIENLEWTTISQSGPPLKVAINLGKLYIIDGSGYPRNNYTFWNERITQLDKKFISDTVLKTTPQELSDDDKNQALANLGIDPVVWKYICNPYVYVAEHGVPLPSDLRNIIEDANGQLKNITLKLLLYGMIDENNDIEVFNIQSIHTGSNSIKLFNDATFYYVDGIFEI